MNTKQVIIASMFAAASFGAHASDIDAAAFASAGTVSVQAAQANTSPVVSRLLSGAAASTLSNCVIGYSEAASSTICPAPDSRTRAEVRAETAKWAATRAQRFDATYSGGAQ